MEKGVLRYIMIRIKLSEVLRRLRSEQFLNHEEEFIIS